MTDNTRILVLVKGLGIGGAERLISSGSAYWDLDHFEYHVAYILPWKDALVPELSDRAVSVTCIGGNRGVDPLVPLRWRSLLRKVRPDLVHAHLPSAGILARLFTSQPVVYTEHNVVTSYRRVTQALNRFTYHRNAATLAVSDAVLGSITRFPGRPAQLVENGVSVTVDGDAAIRARSELGVAPGRPLIVHVGNIRPHKGHSNLIEAAALLVERHPEARVVSIGGEKAAGDLDRVRSAAAARGLSEHLTFLGSRPDALDFIAAADIFVNPADVEGLPVAILEAMALGKPVVATAVGGVPSVIIDGETGLLVPPKDPDSLSVAVSELLANPEHQRRLGDAARQLIEDRYSLARMVADYEGVYEQVLGAVKQ